MHLPAAYSKQDEYIPSSVQKEALLNRLVTGMNNGEESGPAKGLLLENAITIYQKVAETKPYLLKQ